MKTEFEIAFKEIEEARALPKDQIVEALRNALVSAYQREAGIGKSQRVEVVIDEKTWRQKIFVEKEVADEIFDARTEVDLETARYYEPEAQLGDMVMVQVETSIKGFGRIAAQNAKQVILQKIREAERKQLYDEFIAREGDIIHGMVQSVSGGNVTISIGRTEAVMPRNQQIPGERYKPHDRVRGYILEVKATTRGPQITISRAHRNMLRRLLEYEVPEIANGQVEIKNIAREAGYRSKVAVAALQDGVDPVGACVGMRGGRIQNIVKELHDEKIDVIEWNPNQEQFIAKALSPAKVSGVYLEDDPDTGRTAVVIVPDESLSLAIGKEGQNARLAAKLTNWRIDIKSVSDAVQESLEHIDEAPLKDLQGQLGDMVADVQRIIEKKTAGRVVMPEEYTLMARFADVTQRRVMAERDKARQARIAQVNAVRATLPQQAFRMPIEALDIPDAMIEALQPLETVGEIMLRFLIDENRLRYLLQNTPGEPLVTLQTALDNLVIPEEAPVVEAPAESDVAVGEEMAAPTAEAIDGVGVVRDAFVDGVAPDGTAKPQPARGFRPPVIEEVVVDDEDEDALSGNKKGGKGKKKSRQLVYDERSGGMVVKRQRKRGARGGWNDWEE